MYCCVNIMNTPKLNEEYPELCAYSNIHYTPAWYWQRFPGFFNVECYRILANWEHSVPDDEEEQRTPLPSMNEESLPSMSEESLLKKRKVDNSPSK